MARINPSITAWMDGRAPAIEEAFVELKQLEPSLNFWADTYMTVLESPDLVYPGRSTRGLVGSHYVGNKMLVIKLGWKGSHPRKQQLGMKVMTEREINAFVKIDGLNMSCFPKLVHQNPSFTQYFGLTISTWVGKVSITLLLQIDLY